jgi:leader peptidase (prepilin peptidase)/N-methyltransferase
MLIEIGIFLIGLAIGSFLNVCIYRLPREESIVKPGSHCPNCNKLIRWYDNIPILSYIFLRGKCRYCSWKIPLRYPIVELITALALFFYYRNFGFSFLLFKYFILTAVLIIATFTDFKHQIIPDQVSLGFIPVGFIFFILQYYILHQQNFISSIVNSILGIIIGALIIYATGILGRILFKKESMGIGDVKLMAMIGAFLGYKAVILIYFIAPFFGIFYGLYKRIFYKEEYIPYGPFLAMASIVVIFWQDKILSYFMI